MPNGIQRSYPLPQADGVSIDREEEGIVARQGNHIYAFALSCPHENTALRWHPADVRFQCPRHESKYTPDGTSISGRATRNMDRFAIRLDGQKIIVDLAKLYRSDQHRDRGRYRYPGRDDFRSSRCLLRCSPRPQFPYPPGAPASPRSVWVCRYHQTKK